MGRRRWIDSSASISQIYILSLEPVAPEATNSLSPTVVAVNDTSVLSSWVRLHTMEGDQVFQRLSLKYFILYHAALGVALFTPSLGEYLLTSKSRSILTAVMSRAECRFHLRMAALKKASSDGCTVHPLLFLWNQSPRSLTSSKICRF